MIRSHAPVIIPVVALHPEGVDRNIDFLHTVRGFCRVALHPEGVDRNILLYKLRQIGVESPSTRRAWIEIYGATLENGMVAVALHPEGVDRNRYSICSFSEPSVALHPEGVDRNLESCVVLFGVSGRPPPGGRG